MNATVVLPKIPLGAAQLAAQTFLAGYEGNTRAAYTKDLEIFYRWCALHQLDPMMASRPHLELFSRHLSEERFNKPASVHRRLTTIRCFYRMATIDEYIPKSPAEHLRLPKLYFDESKTLGLSRTELAAIIHHARGANSYEWALVALMGLCGLRVGEACSVLIQHTHGENRGHRTLNFVGKGTKPATIPLPPMVARAIDGAADDREVGPLLLRPDGNQMDRRCAARIVARLGKKVGVSHPVTPHQFRHGYITNGLDAGIPIRDMQVGARHADPRMTQRYDRNRLNLDRHPNYTLTAYIAGASER